MGAQPQDIGGLKTAVAIRAGIRFLGLQWPPRWMKLQNMVRIRWGKDRRVVRIHLRGAMVPCDRDDQGLKKTQNMADDICLVSGSGAPGTPGLGKMAQDAVDRWRRGSWMTIKQIG